MKGDRNIALLWGSSTVSALGTAITFVALPLAAVVTLHVPAFEVGLLTAAGTAPWLLFGLVSGVWADRLPGRRLLVTCDLARAAVLLSVPVAAAAGLLTLGQILGVAFVIGVSTVFFDVTFQSYVPALVSSGRLLWVNSRLEASAQVATVGGPALGGLLVQILGAPATLLTDMASYVISAACLSMTGDRRTGAASAPAPGGQLAQIREGMAYVWTSSALRSLTLSATSFNLCQAGILTLQIVFLVRSVHVRPALVGVLIAADGAGALLGALASSGLTRRLGSGRVVVLSVTAGPTFAVLMPLTTPGPGLLLFVTGMAGLALFTAAFSVVARVYRQITVPRHLLGRVTAVNRFVSWGGIPLGSLIAGALGSAIGVRPALWAVVVAQLVMTPLPVLLSPLRHTRDITAAPSQGGEAGHDDSRQDAGGQLGAGQESMAAGQSTRIEDLGQSASIDRG